MPKENQLVKYEGESPKELILEAAANFEAIKQTGVDIANKMLDLAALFYHNRTQGYYKMLGYERWQDFVADPETGGYRSSTIRGLILIYRKYVVEMGADKPLLSSIGFSKLRIISPVVEADPDEWLAKANTLSKSDLILEVKEAQGESIELPATVPHHDQPPIYPGLCSSYSQYVTRQPCCVCDDPPPSDPAHWPVTQDPGDDPGNEEWKIPLCRECHSEFHRRGDLSFFKAYRRKIGRYLFGLILRPFKGEPHDPDDDGEYPEDPDYKEAQAL